MGFKEGFDTTTGILSAIIAIPIVIFGTLLLLSFIMLGFTWIVGAVQSLINWISPQVWLGIPALYVFSFVAVTFPIFFIYSITFIMGKE